MTRRRTFLALLGAAAAASATNVGAEETGSEQGVEPTEAAAELDPAEALLAYVVANYGDRLDEDDREVIREGIEGSLEAAAAFREVGLENADEPAYGFSAYRGDER